MNISIFLKAKKHCLKQLGHYSDLHSELGPGLRYQVLFFSGPGYLPHQAPSFLCPSPPTHPFILNLNFFFKEVFPTPLWPDAAPRNLEFANRMLFGEEKCTYSSVHTAWWAALGLNFSAQSGIFVQCKNHRSVHSSSFGLASSGASLAKI